MSEIDDLLKSLGFSSGIRGSHSSKSATQSPAQDQIRPKAAASQRLSAASMPTSSHAADVVNADLHQVHLDMVPSQELDGHHDHDSHSDQDFGTNHQKFWNRTNTFSPEAPDTLEEAGLYTVEVSTLLLKVLSMRGVESGYNMARVVGLKFPIVDGVLRQMKVERLVSYRNSSTGGDYLYELTDLGRERATQALENSSYIGTAPVPLHHYVESVKAQTIATRKPPIAAIRKAFADLDIEDELLFRIGEAIHSARGMFLYGPAGNGKTSIAERITLAFGDTIWIPRIIVASGEIIRLFDPNRHKVAAISGSDPELFDGRWVQIERPTIIAGGELQLDNLEITYTRRAGVGEAPLQMKANCGTLLIDDFGRQRMSTDALLNRWIVPLEHRHDYLHLESGRSIQVPFDELIIFSTNLQPKDLVDEAFLRRIPYKIEIDSPTKTQFRNLFIRLAEEARFKYTESDIDYLIQTHYEEGGRQYRYCQPRDLLRQIENRCSLFREPLEVTRSTLDSAVRNYFSVMLDE